MPKIACDESCSGVPGGAEQLGFQHGLLWRCQRCGRIWRVRHEFSAALFKGAWVWRPVSSVTRWLINRRLGRWTWADELGIQ